MAIYTSKTRIDLEDVGYSNKITNKAILKILENAGARQSETIHFGLNDMENVGFSWILLGWKVKILKRPIYNEELTINTWGRESNRIFTYRDYEIYDESGELCTIATSKWAIEDLQKLQEQWKDIYQKFKKSDSKSQLLYTSPSIVEKIMLDLPSEKIDSIIVNTKEDYSELEQVVSHKIKLALEENKNLIKKYELENQIEKAKQRKVWLNCGGFITIDPTEALVAIDVNSGKYTGKNTLEETVYKVNYEATIEIAKQLRLRDIGGIIIIDYIDMKDIEHKEKIEKLLKETLKQDRAKTQVEGFTKLNLMELTRKHICAHNS